MTTRRVFLGGALAAASALTLPGLAYGQGSGAQGSGAQGSGAQVSGGVQGRIAKIRTRDGAELFVKDSGGTGRAVVMTHAWPLSADIWNFQAAALSRSGYRVITYDRRGFGRSSQPATGYDFDTFADDLAEVIEQTGIRDATLVGYSMGGGEVVRYFSRHKGRNVARAGFVGAAAYYLLKSEGNPGGIDAGVFDGIKQGVLGDRRAYLAGLLKDVFFDAGRPATNPVTQENLDAARAMAMQASATATASCVDAFSKTDFRAELASVKVPTLVLHGTADIPVPFALAKAMAAGIARSKLVEYQDASHGIVVTERDRVARDLQAFIAI